MPVSRTSRELASRVEVDFHKRPNRFRRVTWGLACLFALGAFAWLAFAGARGEQRIYEADDVATPHRMFENDCAKCHGGSEWAPLERLVTFNNDIHSVSNDKCIACHRGPAHHHNQVPAHDDISCAVCHREHEGDEKLAWVEDNHCVGCHADLQTESGPTEIFARHITGFDAGADSPHPTFAVERLVKSQKSEVEIGPGHDVFDVLAYMERPGEERARWQDQARIRFNHAVHLKAAYEDGKLVEGLRNEKGELVDLSQNCTTCHEYDAERRYMRPISYERHCRQCHPLYFDTQLFPEQVVPHRQSDLVRGWLTELYTLRALKREAPADAEDAEADPRAELLRIESEQRLGKEQAERVKAQVDQAQQFVLQTRERLGLGGGGCQYCHETKNSADDGSWSIVPPRIPERWMTHSVFRHDSHRMLGCTECHTDLATGKAVNESRSTGDVLLPAIALCRQCHSHSLESVSRALVAGFEGARANCVECHVYHHREDENPDGRLNAALMPRDSGRGELASGAGSKENEAE